MISSEIESHPGAAPRLEVLTHILHRALEKYSDNHELTEDIASHDVGSHDAGSERA